MTRIGKLLLAIAVGASLPAMAIAQRGQSDPDRNGNQREDRGQNRRGDESRGYGAGQPTRAEQLQQPEQPQRAERPEQAQRSDRPQQDFNRDRTPDRNGPANDRTRGYDRRGDGYRNNDGYRGSDGYRGNDGRRYGDNRRYDDRGRPNDARWVGSNWRQDRRYDWRSYRDYNRGQFHIGRYAAPRGWSYGYRRFSVGAVLPGLLWGSGFWLDDPYQYHLPPAYAPYRWVRYYDDVLLIDTRSGRVVDAIPGFFW